MFPSKRKLHRSTSYITGEEEPCILWLDIYRHDINLIPILLPIPTTSLHPPSTTISPAGLLDLHT